MYQCSIMEFYFQLAFHFGDEFNISLLLCLIAQLCPTPCDLTHCSPPGSSVHGDSPGKNTGVGCHGLLQGIFQVKDWTQVSHVAGDFLLPEPPRKHIFSPPISSVQFKHHSSKASILRCSVFFTVQLSHPYMTTGKSIALTWWNFVGKVMSLLFNLLSSLGITFLPRSKHLLISWLQSPSAVILEPTKIKSDTDLSFLNVEL